MEETNDTIITYDSYREPVTFAVLLLVAIPAIICTLVILIFFFSHWHSMITKALHHHAIFLLIIISFLYTTFDLPFSLNYFRIGYHPYRSIPFCLWWYWFDYSLLAMSLFLTATASIQRHILIFNSQWLHVSKKRWLLHYIPLIISVVYPPLFYAIFMFLYPCTVYFDQSEGWCAYPCYIDNTVLFNIDWIFNTIFPVFIIVLANITLIIRVFRSMKRIRQQQTGAWKRQKILTLQLLAVSSLYIIVYLPTTILAILHVLAFPNLYNDIPNLYYIFHMIYFVCPLQSFLCICVLPELIGFIKRKGKRLLMRSHVVPATYVRPTA
jgi:hypothetical protein